MTIQEAQKDRKQLESTIAQAIQEFEKKYGSMTFRNFTFRRWNGSNTALGNVVSVCADVRILDADGPSETT